MASLLQDPLEQGLGPDSFENLSALPLQEEGKWPRSSLGCYRTSFSFGANLWWSCCHLSGFQILYTHPLKPSWWGSSYSLFSGANFPGALSASFKRLLSPDLCPTP